MSDERYALTVSEDSLRRAILHGLLVINEHHDGCAKPGSDCPVGIELRDVAERAAIPALWNLLGIDKVVGQ